jgi:hypothetical protein
MATQNRLRIEPIPPWAVVGAGLVVAALVALFVFASRDRHETRREAVESLRILADDRHVEGVVTTNTCGDRERLDVEESPTRVIVVAVVRWRVNGDCDDVGMSHTLTTELERPLGERELVAGRD